jgi:hypothetical protein
VDREYRKDEKQAKHAQAVHGREAGAGAQLGAAHPFGHEGGVAAGKWSAL